MIPRTTLDREPALLECLNESYWTVELPSNAADGGAHHVRNADRFVVDVHTHLHFYSEAKATYLLAQPNIPAILEKFARVFIMDGSRVWEFSGGAAAFHVLRRSGSQ